MPNVELYEQPAAPPRRTFLKQLCAGGLLCMGCGRTAQLAQPATSRQPNSPPQPTPPEQSAAPRQSFSAPPQSPYKFAAQSKMTFERVFNFAFSGGSIPLLQRLADEIGREKFLPMLQEVATKSVAEWARKIAPHPPKNTLEAMHPPPDYFWSHVLTAEWVEKTDTVHESRTTECLWAKTFRAANASEIGYAWICHPDFAFASAYNPKIRMIRTKTLMQGHDCCNPRWIMET
jgi:hypothetical protein